MKIDRKIFHQNKWRAKQYQKLPNTVYRYNICYIPFLCAIIYKGTMIYWAHFLSFLKISINHMSMSVSLFNASLSCVTSNVVIVNYLLADILLLINKSSRNNFSLETFCQWFRFSGTISLWSELKCMVYNVQYFCDL